MATSTIRFNVVKEVQMNSTTASQSIALHSGGRYLMLISRVQSAVLVTEAFSIVVSGSGSVTTYVVKLISNSSATWVVNSDSSAILGDSVTITNSGTSIPTAISIQLLQFK